MNEMLESNYHCSVLRSCKISITLYYSLPKLGEDSKTFGLCYTNTSLQIAALALTKERTR